MPFDRPIATRPSSARSTVSLFAGLFCIALASCSLQQSPCCASFPMKSFRAVYDGRVQGNGTERTYKQIWLSDGSGKIRLTNEGSPNDTYVDFVGATSTTLLPEKKLAVESALKSPWISHGTEEETGASDLGARTIDGHNCHGWKVKTDKAESEYWLAEDNGTYVEITSVLPDKNKVTLHLAECKEDKSAPAEFQIPPGYTVEKDKPERVHPIALNGVSDI